MGGTSSLSGANRPEFTFSNEVLDTFENLFGVTETSPCGSTTVCSVGLDDTLRILFDAFPTATTRFDLNMQLSTALSGAAGVAVPATDVIAGLQAATPAEILAINKALFSAHPNNSIGIEAATGQAFENDTLVDVAGSGFVSVANS